MPRASSHVAWASSAASRAGPRVGESPWPAVRAAESIQPVTWSRAARKAARNGSTSLHEGSHQDGSASDRSPRTRTARIPASLATMSPRAGRRLLPRVGEEGQGPQRQPALHAVRDPERRVAGQLPAHSRGLVMKSPPLPPRCSGTSTASSPRSPARQERPLKREVRGLERVDAREDLVAMELRREVRGRPLLHRQVLWEGRRRARPRSRTDPPGAARGRGLESWRSPRWRAPSQPGVPAGGVAPWLRIAGCTPQRVTRRRHIFGNSGGLRDPLAAFTHPRSPEIAKRRPGGPEACRKLAPSLLG